MENLTSRYYQIEIYVVAIFSSKKVRSVSCKIYQQINHLYIHTLSL